MAVFIQIHGSAVHLHLPEGWWTRSLPRSTSCGPCGAPSSPSPTWCQTECIPVGPDKVKPIRSTAEANFTALSSQQSSRHIQWQIAVIERCHDEGTGSPVLCSGYFHSLDTDVLILKGGFNITKGKCWEHYYIMKCLPMLDQWLTSKE